MRRPVTSPTIRNDPLTDPSQLLKLTKLALHFGLRLAILQYDIARLIRHITYPLHDRVRLMRLA